MKTDNNKKIILDLCGGTGSWSKPYRDAGYDVRLITLPEFDVTDVSLVGDRIFFYRSHHKPLLDVELNSIYGILAAPPCVQFSLARTTAKTPRDFNEGMKIVEACMKIIWNVRANGNLKFWALENPTAYLRQFLGKPPMTFQPYDFGDPYKKQTDLWGYYNEPKKKPIILTEKEIYDSRFNTRPLPKIKGLSVADRRAITPAGFAKAFFESNK